MLQEKIILFRTREKRVIQNERRVLSIVYQSIHYLLRGVRSSENS